MPIYPNQQHLDYNGAYNSLKSKLQLVIKHGYTISVLGKMPLKWTPWALKLICFALNDILSNLSHLQQWFLCTRTSSNPRKEPKSKQKRSFWKKQNSHYEVHVLTKWPRLPLTSSRYSKQFSYLLSWPKQIRSTKPGGSSGILEPGTVAAVLKRNSSSRHSHKNQCVQTRVEMVTKSFNFAVCLKIQWCWEKI